MLEARTQVSNQTRNPSHNRHKVRLHAYDSITICVYLLDQLLVVVSLKLQLLVKLCHLSLLVAAILLLLLELLQQLLVL